MEGALVSTTFLGITMGLGGQGFSVRKDRVTEAIFKEEKKKKRKETSGILVC